MVDLGVFWTIGLAAIHGEEEEKVENEENDEERENSSWWLKKIIYIKIFKTIAVLSLLFSSSLCL